MSTVGFYTDAGEQTNVSASVAAAEAAAEAAAASANDSATSEANALSYSNNASTSASNAGTSETNASASETSAAMSATDSANSAIASAASAVDANVSEGNALTSENAAATSAAAALVSENNAAATLAGALTKIDNLSDVSDVTTSRTNLDVYSKEETDNGRRNYLINGDLKEWQRGTNFDGAAGYYADRFRKSASWSTTERSSDVPSGAIYSAHIANASANLTCAQGIELPRTGIKWKFQTGTSFTVQIKANITDGTGSPTCELQHRDVVGSAAGQATIVGQTASNEPVTNGSWQLYTFNLYVPAWTANPTAKTVECVIRFTGATDVYWTQVQLEEGSTATPFGYVSPADNLAKCQRYYQRLSHNFTAAGHAETTTTAAIAIPFTHKRVPPTISTLDATQFLVVNSVGSGIATTAFSTTEIGLDSVGVLLSVAGGLVGGNGTRLLTSAGGTIEIDAEL